jgi:hypothetical protein
MVTTMPVWCGVFALLVGCAAVSSGHSGLRTVADPERDDYGPGGYVYPEGSVYRPGALDLREVRLTQSGPTVEVTVTFHAPVAIARGVRLAREQVGDLFIATVDIYLDLDRGGQSGEARGLTGRRVRLADGARWDVAVVLSPIPARLGEALSGRVTGGSVFIPKRVRVRGKTLSARFPTSALGGVRVEDVGVSAAVTGTVFGSTFRSGVDGMVPTGFVREVTEVPGRCGRWEEALDGAPCTFGGCASCEGHSRVIDALHPVRGVQEAGLSRGLEGLEAALPVNWSVTAPQAAVAQPTPSRPEAAVVDRRAGLVTLRAGPDGFPDEGAFLEGCDSDGHVVGTFVMGKQLLASGAHMGVAEWVSGALEEVVLLRWGTQGR